MYCTTVPVLAALGGPIAHRLILVRVISGLLLLLLQYGYILLRDLLRGYRQKAEGSPVPIIQ